ncbi:alanine--glyoxylate aminotransferase family protein [candidate division NPL-UPA2 bacterium]|nr:alanine--glyoxylate aminotransferase family protein [candidate division NPL-UPA2 bacterium]
MKKKYLLAPGPTPVPAEVLAAMGQPIIHHRTSEYKEIFSQVNEGLKYIFQTKNDVLTFASSGTGAMEGAVVNLLSPGDKILVVRGGKFGERFGEIGEAYGVEVVPLDVEWGKPVDPADIGRKLEEVRDVKAVFATLCETSTGVANDIRGIGGLVKNYEAILVVDAISGLGAMEFKPDDWKVDVVVAGSQKGLMIPPGLSFVSLSEKGWKLVRESKLPKYYFSFEKVRGNLKKNDHPFTPAISLMLALREAVRMIREEGLENVWERHARLAEATRAGVSALGLELFAPQAPANSVTAVKVPEGIDGVALVKNMREKQGITIAGGQAHLKGKIFRIAHLGYADQLDVTLVISALEMVLSGLGYKVEFGRGVAAAERILVMSNKR